MDYILLGSKSSNLWRANILFRDYGYKASLTEAQINEVKKQNLKVEPDYEMTLLELPLLALSNFSTLPLLIVIIGKSKMVEGVQYRYDMKKGMWQNEDKQQGELTIIDCYTEGTFVRASDYLKTIDTVSLLARQLNKQLIIIQAIESTLPYFRSQSLTQKIRDQYVKDYNVIIFSRGDERYFNNKKFVSATELEILMRAWVDKLALGQSKQDIFYESIRKKDKDYLGLNKEKVSFFEVPLMKPISGTSRQKIMTIKSPYKGRGTVIAFITTHHGDYGRESLRDERKHLRVKGVWEQIKGEEGILWEGEAIEGQLEKWREEEDNNNLEEITSYLQQIGGKAIGMAEECEFFIAKVKIASPNLTAVYGTSNELVSTGDLISSIKKIEDWAKNENKILLVIIPYRGYLSSHKEEQCFLESLTYKENQVILIPTGDEGDKRRHIVIGGEKRGKQSIRFEYGGKAVLTARIVGEKCNLSKVHLITPQGKEFTLMRRCYYKAAEERIVSSGWRVNPKIGSEEILWQIEKGEKGEWTLALEKEEKIGEVQITLEADSGKEKICGCTGYQTMNTLGGVEPLYIGCFNERDKTVYSFSGRGNDREMPTLVVSDSLVNGKSMKSTIEATCISSGVIACLCEKLKNSVEEDIITTQTVKKKLIDCVEKDKMLSYPNNSLGYGKLGLEEIKSLLEVEENSL